MTLTKAHNDFPVIYPKEMDIYEIPEKEYKIITLGSSVRLKGTQIHNSVKSGK